jgi:hypothetical protein
MANNNWNNYTEKTATPVDADEVMVRDSADGKNKKLLFGTFWKWVAKKLNEATISELQTSNKTIVGALNQLNSDMVGKIHALSTDCGYLYFRKSADAVSVFGTLKVINQNNIDNPTIGEIPDFLNPNYDYAVLNVISNYAPYIPVGTLWIYRNGEIKLYHNAENTDFFVFGSYIIDRS